MSEQAESPHVNPQVIRDEATTSSSETTLADVKQLGLWAAIGSFSYERIIPALFH